MDESVYIPTPNVFPTYSHTNTHRHNHNTPIQKIVCATNVAETSITIPDVTVVIDAGRVKENGTYV